MTAFLRYGFFALILAGAATLSACKTTEDAASEPPAQSPAPADQPTTPTTPTTPTSGNPQ